MHYQKIEALVECIEIEVESLCAEDPSVFVVDQVDCRFAITRALYFSLVNNPIILETNPVLLRHHFQSDLELQVAQRLFKKLPTSPSILSRCIYWIKGISHLVRATLIKQDTFTKKTPHSDTVFYIRQNRFIQYILEALRFPAANCAILSLNKSVLEHAKQSGLSTCSMRFGSIRLPSPSSLMWQFPHLVVEVAQLKATLRIIQPKRIVIIEGNDPSDEVISKVAEFLGIPCVCIQQGWSPMIHNGFRNLSFSKMLVWGKGFADILSVFSPQQEMVITGNPIISSIGKQKKPQAIGFFLQSPGPYISEEQWNRFFELILWTASEFPLMKILVREHPNFPLGSFEKKNLKSHSNIQLSSNGISSLPQVLRQVKLCISIFSTTLLECAAMGSFSLIVNEGSLRQYTPKLDSYGIGKEARSIEEAKNEIRIIMDQEYSVNPKLVEKFRRDYFHSKENISIRVYQEILKIHPKRSL